MSKRKKIRVSIQKNFQARPKDRDLTRAYRDDPSAAELAERSERVRAKGSASRKRTVVVDESEALAIREKDCRRGRVLSVQGLYCTVVTEDGTSHRCYTRRLLKAIESTERNVVATGDWVWFRPAPGNEGLIVRVEPRRGAMTRGYRQREQVIAANIDQMLIVGSLVEPLLKPNLIDRYLVAAERSGIGAVLCLNKVDRVDGALVQPYLGVYNQIGYPAVLTSAATGQGIETLRGLVAGKESVIVGQSGVGKSSLLNALEPDFRLKVREVSTANQKGRHTTTNARLLPLTGGGSVIDTPGVRQFEVWDLPPAELSQYFIEFRPFAAHCRFPGCTHVRESECGVRTAAAEGWISLGRYDSYLKLFHGEAAEGVEFEESLE